MTLKGLSSRGPRRNSFGTVQVSRSNSQQNHGERRSLARSADVITAGRRILLSQIDQKDGSEQTQKKKKKKKK